MDPVVVSKAASQFVAAFKAAATSATDAQAIAYHTKLDPTLDGAQCAALFSSAPAPSVPASELSKGSGANTVMVDGKSTDVSGD